MPEIGTACRPVVVAKVDGRTREARRYRDLFKAFADEAGGVETLSASAQQLIRRLAQVSIELELQESQRASGQAIDPVAFVTLVNSQRRLLKDLEALKKRQKPKALLQEHLARHYGTQDAAA
jgi:hypothetical protein